MVAEPMRDRASIHADVLALGALVVLSPAAHLGRLGFSSDDWDFLRAMAFAPDGSLAGSFEALDADPNIHPRPVQALYQAILFALFGTSPLGYHLAGAALLVAAAVLLHLLLRELGPPRLLAVAVPALFAVFPAYATDRLWFAAHGYLLAMAACFLSVWADLRAARGDRVRWPWKLLALAALLISALGFEIAIPFLALGAALVARRAWRPGRGRALALVAPNMAALAAILAFKLAASPGAHLSESVPEHLARLFGGAALVRLRQLRRRPPAGRRVGARAGRRRRDRARRARRSGPFAHLWHVGGGVDRRAWLALAAAGVPGRGHRRAAASPAPDTTVILEGVCPYVGPAIVADSDWAWPAPCGCATAPRTCTPTSRPQGACGWGRPGWSPATTGARCGTPTGRR